MHFRLIFLGVLLTVTNTYGNQQIQIPEAGAFISDEELVDQIDKLRHNVSDLWENFSALKSVLTETLNHLRVHQAELEETVHMLEHKHEDSGSSHGTYTDDHHHHHSGEQHGSDSHSHGDDDHHHHSGEQHSHGDDHSHDGDSHSHSGEQHSHGDDHYHRSYSHSYSSASHQHGDSHEKGDDIQQTQQEANPMIEPLVVATTAQHHNHQHPPHPAISNSLLLINDSHFNRPHSHHQHHHSHHSRSERNRTVVIPKVSEVGLYDFAVCNVQPNRAIPEDQQQDVMGRINLWQKKSGGPLNIHIRLQGFYVGGEHGHHHGAHQAVQQESMNDISVTAGHRHGFHIHTLGDLSNGCQSTGPHFNPKGVNHGSPNALVRHVGDLGNIECDDHGNANIIFNDEIASMKGPYSIIGKSMVIHAGQDDFGLGGNDESLRTGNAGTRIACCVIEKVDKLPIRSYKFIKAATPYQNA